MFLLAACWAPLHPDLAAMETVLAETEDGWRLPVYHHPGAGPPLLMVHGMGANHYNFDWRRDSSLAAWLAGRGWDVWVPALRGDFDAEGPAGDYRFDDHALRDVPAILDAVRARTGAPQVYWVGHSMGGMLLYTSLATLPERVAAGVAIGSPAAFEHPPRLHVLARDNPWVVAGGGRLPFRALGRLAGFLGAESPVNHLLAWPGSLDDAVVAGLSRDALTDLPRAVARQANDWLRSGSLTRADGSPWMREAEVPLLALGMSEDRVVPWWYVVAACRWVHPCDFRLLGVAGGFSTEYGHIDPVLAEHAKSEVWPLVDAFLRRQAAAGASDAG